MKRGNSTGAGARRRAHTTLRALALRALALALSLLAGALIQGLPGGQLSVPAAEAAPAAGVDGNGIEARDIHVPASASRLAYCLHIPAGTAQPRVMVLALHGIGGSGEEMLAAVRPAADALGWAVIAPTVSYGDWRDPDQLLHEELWLQPQLIRLIDEAFRDAGLATPRSVVAFGFSRGAQAAERLALLYPERISAVASLSGGAYTLPVASVSAGGSVLAAPLPYGIADFEQRIGRAPNVSALRRVRFWVGVGARDTSAGDVPRQWDRFEGSNRVERAQRLTAAVSQLGGDAQLALLPNTGHELTALAVEQAFHFLATAPPR